MEYHQLEHLQGKHKHLAICYWNWLAQPHITNVTDLTFVHSGLKENVNEEKNVHTGKLKRYFSIILFYPSQLSILMSSVSNFRFQILPAKAYIFMI